MKSETCGTACRARLGSRWRAQPAFRRPSVNQIAAKQAGTKFECRAKRAEGHVVATAEKAKLDGAGMPLVELLVRAGLCSSKGQARKDIEGGGVNVNNVRESSFQRAVTTNDLLFGKHLLLPKGKRNYAVLSVR
jgi:tyrosyl-tRNA synthetase